MWTNDDYLASINDISCEDVQAFIPQLLTNGIFIEALVFGNMSKEVKIKK
jgi:secreted Zn-dependent insulinase-like peptidase